MSRYKKNLIRYNGYCILLTIFVTGLALLLSCSVGPIAGSGTEEGNVTALVEGVVYDSSGNTASCVKVTLVPKQYNPVEDTSLSSSFIDTTDSGGRYSFAFTGKDTFNIQALQESRGTRFLHTNIIVDNDTIDDLADTLKEPGTIKVILPDTVDLVNGYLFIAGTDIYKAIDTQVVYLDSVPAGLMPSLYYATGIANELITDSLIVIPNDTIIQAKVLLIVRLYNDTVASSDQYFKAKIEEMGLSVKVVSSSDAYLADTAGVDAVIFSPTAGQELIEYIFTGISMPILNLEVGMLKFLMMTDTLNKTDFGFDSAGTEWEILHTSHPVSAGFLGLVQVFTDSSTKHEWGKPFPSAQKIAILPGEPDKSTIFCYEKGAEMRQGMLAPDKRGTFLLWSGDVENNLSADGWQILHNMVHWIFE